jgi:hypothetical protein
MAIIRFACLKCHKRFKSVTEHGGKLVHCTGCGAPITIPVQRDMGRVEVDPIDDSADDDSTLWPGKPARSEPPPLLPLPSSQRPQEGSSARRMRVDLDDVESDYPEAEWDTDDVEAEDDEPPRKNGRNHRDRLSAGAVVGLALGALLAAAAMTAIILLFVIPMMR